MATDDQAARKARAKRLREQIDDLVKGTEPIPAAQVPPDEEGLTAPRKQESPREFINRRMRELKETETDS
jgi:hypothetical protein